MLTISPPRVSLAAGKTQAFSATDQTGAAVKPKWSISPALATIDENGLYAAPVGVTEPATVTVKAALNGDSAEAIVTLEAAPAGALAIVPSGVQLRAGEAQTFRALAGGAEAPGVVWTLSPDIGTLANSRYTAPAEVRDRTIRIIATGPGFTSAEATIGLLEPQPSGWIRIGLGIYLMLIFACSLLITQLMPPVAGDSQTLGRLNAEMTAAATEFREAVAKGAAAGATDEDKKRLAAAQKILQEKQDEVRQESDRVETLRKAEVRTDWFGTLSRDVALLWVVLLSGALGAFVYSAKSFVSYLGNESFKCSWTPWYLMMPGIGAGLALVFYLVFRGGFLSGVSGGSSINPYGFAAVSAMVGMFTKQATNKLDEVFSTMFRTATPPELKDKLPEAKDGESEKKPAVKPQGT